MISSERQTTLRSAAARLFEARRTPAPIADLPADMQPASLEEAYFVQDALAPMLNPGAASGPRSWKVGAPAPDASPLFAPMTSAWIADDASLLTGSRHRLRGLEGEVSFLIGRDLPPRATFYSRDEVIASIASCHPAIEELESGFAEISKVAPLTKIADLQAHGGFVHGPAVSAWQSIDFTRESVTLAVDGKQLVQATASNSAGTDLIRLILYLVNEGAPRTGGLQRGSWVTTGSWTGNTFASPGSVVNVRFSTVGPVSLRFA